MTCSNYWIWISCQMIHLHPILKHGSCPFKESDVSSNSLSMQHIESSMSLISKIECILLKTFSNNSGRVLLSCFMPAPNQIFCICCQQSSSKIFSRLVTHILSQWAVILLGSDWWNFCTTAQVSAILLFVWQTLTAWGHLILNSSLPSQHEQDTFLQWHLAMHLITHRSPWMSAW